MNEKKIIQVPSHWIECYSSYTPEQLEAQASIMRSNGIETVGIDGPSDYGVEFYETRLETDKEFNKRIKQEERARIKTKKYKLITEKYERKQYEKLHQKYGSK